MKTRNSMLRSKLLLLVQPLIINAAVPTDLRIGALFPLVRTDRSFDNSGILMFLSTMAKRRWSSSW